MGKGQGQVPEYAKYGAENMQILTILYYMDCYYSVKSWFNYIKLFNWLAQNFEIIQLKNVSEFDAADSLC